jgi:hypothetical protein
MRFYLIIPFTLFTLTGLTQEEKEPKVFLQAGFGLGIPFIQQIENQPYVADIYTGYRKKNAFIRIGAGINLSNRDRLDIVFQPNAFQINKKDVKDAYLTRLPNHYIYHDFNVDNTNSTGNGNSLYSIDIQYSRKFTAGKLDLLPYGGSGIGFWNHRDYRYVLRAHNSNDFSTYSFKLKTNPSITYSTGLRVTWKKLRNNEIDLSFIGSYAKLRYDVNMEPGSQLIAPSTDDISFNRFVHAIRIGFIGHLKE